MHPIQKKIMDLAQQKDIGSMTLREIGTSIGEPHPQKIKHHISQLIKKGLIKSDKKSNKLEVVQSGERDSGDFIFIPIMGSANCGEATMVAEENIEGMLTVSKSILSYKNSLMAIKAVGNSMNRANVQGCAIEDGDYAIVDCERKSPANGDYVLSIIDGLANIKRFIMDNEHNQVVLISESTQDYPPIYIHNDDYSSYMVNGTVIKVIKKPKFEPEEMRRFIHSTR